MSYDQQIYDIEKERMVLEKNLEPIYSKLYELQEKKKQLLREKELASGTLTPAEELEFRRALGIFKEITKTIEGCSIYFEEKEAKENKAFDFEISTNYISRHREIYFSVHLSVVSKVLAVSALLEEMIGKPSSTGRYWEFNKYSRLELKGTLTEEEYTKALEEID